MFRRIDEGWDLQVEPGTPILAIAAGTISYSHDPNGFGDPYPVLTFDEAQAGQPACYYGHNHPDLPEGTHVNQGDVIAHALPDSLGNAAGKPGWLEIGWWNGGPTGNGQLMHDTLINAPIHQGEDMPLSDADLQKLETAITTIAQQQAAQAISVASQPDGVIGQAIGAAANNVNIHLAIALNTVAQMLGFKPPYPDQPAKPTTK